MSRLNVKKSRIYIKKRRICMILAGVMVKNVGYI